MSRTGHAGEPYTRREAEVAALLHLPNKQIALELGMSPETVRKHVSNVLRKAGVLRRAAVPDVRLARLLAAIDELAQWRSGDRLKELFAAREAFR